MNETQMAILVRDVRALCPAQKFDEFTPDAWLEVIGDLDYDDAHAAIVALGRQQPFIGPSDIAAEVRRVANSRPSFRPMTGPAALESAIPDCDPDDVPGYLRALRPRRERAFGELLPRFDPDTLEGTPFAPRSFVDVPSKRPRTNALALQGRAPMLAIEAAPDPAYEDARAVLARITDTGPWLAAAIVALAADNVEEPTPQQIAIRAAHIANQSPNGARP